MRALGEAADTLEIENLPLHAPSTIGILQSMIERIIVRAHDIEIALRLIVQIPEHEIKRCADARMVRLLSKAHDWFNQLASGKAASIQEISDQEEVSRSYVSRVIYLAFLAPDMVRAILAGKHSPLLTSDKLMRNLPLPIDWDEQRERLGFK